MRYTSVCSKAGKTLILKKEKFPKDEITNIYLLASVKYYQWSLLSLNICSDSGFWGFTKKGTIIYLVQPGIWQTKK